MESVGEFAGRRVDQLEAGDCRRIVWVIERIFGTTRLVGDISLIDFAIVDVGLRVR